MNHLTAADFEQFRRAELQPAAIVEFGRHLATCRECAERATAFVKANGGNDSLRLAFAGVAQHPDPELLIRSVDNKLDAAERDAVRDHVELCSTCRAEVADLLSVRNEIRRPGTSSPMRWAIAAAMAGSAITALMITRSPRKSSSPNEFPRVATSPAIEAARDKWEPFIADARARGIERPAFLSEIRPRPDALRGGDLNAPKNEIMAPVGVVVESTQPTFSWNGPGHHFTVSILDGSDIVAVSPLLTTPRWTPAKPLERGHIYEWQVTVRNGHIRVIPESPLPPAFFRVMDGTSQQLIDEARRTHPTDHLLLGILYARAGAQPEATNELSSHLAAHPDDTHARALARAIKSW